MLPHYKALAHTAPFPWIHFPSLFLAFFALGPQNFWVTGVSLLWLGWGWAREPIIQLSAQMFLPQGRLHRLIMRS